MTDELVDAVLEAVRPARPRGRGAAWELCEARREEIEEWLKQGLTVVKVDDLLTRRGVVVPHRTLHCFCVDELGFRRQRTTVRVDDGEPGGEVQVDFGRMGFLVDPETGRRRVVHALIFTAVCSRHMFVWLTHRQTLDDVIAGCDAAWRFFGGVFHVIIPDNLSPVVVKADQTAPRFTDAFVEYAQARGFVVDPARVRRPQDKPRVERAVPHVRGNFFAGEAFIDLADAQRRAERWCAEAAGMRVQRTIQARPAEVFRVEEAPRLLPAPTGPYDLPVYRQAKVHRDHHVEVARALVLGARRADRPARGGPRRLQPGAHQPPRAGRQGPPAHARRWAERRRRRSAVGQDRVRAARPRPAQGDDRRHGPAIGSFAAQLLDVALPWTRMRSVYRLLGLVRKWGDDRIEDACRRALDVEAVDVGLIARMLERATERAEPEPPPPAGNVVTGRFAPDADEFAVNHGQQSAL